MGDFLWVDMVENSNRFVSGECLIHSYDNIVIAAMVDVLVWLLRCLVDVGIVQLNFNDYPTYIDESI